ncbi:prepilin-type N-terminal cleavage/methylation domain-containing protein [Acidithiobacillus ferriphilus]|uniref:Type IV pilin n=8 Tax=Acidithiobacillus TaxID=119977 RepID=A0A179BMQ5_ACIFR|nr:MULTISPECIES: prepilin-type N-terminal cleavage/methylation domain-containing protein [Acidithiobacillus]MDA8181582.1 prepilin-type N-terminal cleavage/methylation domain-containing protein [Acidithiobacillus sp.]MBU2831185.1 prepilin-type N-terminal cleavage/methylation domain-containing protein [Acidithiobacillus ferriphilus]MBU2852496.1 prepilin-type N-terminal cleavage/methylation domain-containing protein [Acidithiobacillus ferriphilus]MEB8521040.1 prepilin-type N-terminal cleavage/meth
MHAPQPSEQGFTLIETMIALAIFAIGSMGILAILMTGFSTTAEGNNLTGGYEMAQNAIGMIRANGSNALQFDGAAVSKTGSVTIPGSANTVVAQAIVSWKNMLHPAALPPALPSANGNIAVISLQGGGMCPCTATISVGWLSNGTPEAYTVQTIVGY